MPHFGKIAAGLMLLLLAACASQIKSDVARFHRLPPPQGESFQVVAADSRKQNSLEFATYAQYVAAEMVKQGYAAAQAYLAAPAPMAPMMPSAAPGPDLPGATPYIPPYMTEI